MQDDTRAPGGSIRVLHVDDDSDFAEMAGTFLEREDDRFVVEIATSASEGLDRLADGEFDCVVSDHDMPRRNGIEFLESVREEDPDLPFILFTGKGSEEVASDAISAGVTDYLQKDGGTDQYTVLANRIENAVQKRRVEQEADRTRTRLEAITENSTDAILTIDAESTIRFANPAVEDLFGYARADLVGAPLTTLMPSRYQDDHHEAVARYLETGERTVDWSAIEFPARHRDGHEVPVSISFGEFQQDGERRFVGVIRDVSQRVRMEEELRKRERHFRQMAENIGEVVWMSDLEKGEMRYVNPAYEDVWERPVENLYEDPASFLDTVHPEDRDRVEDALATQATGDYDEEYRIVRPDGEVRWIHDRAVPIENDAGEVYRIVGIASDITDRKESRRRLETLISNLPGIVYRCRNEPEWPMEYVRGECAELTGYPASTLETDDVVWGGDIIHPDDRDPVWEAVQDALESREPFEVTYRIVTREGTTKWVWERGRGVYTHEGDLDALEGFITDVTEHKEYERRLEQQNERLDGFASMVSHDLRNPLNVAQGRLDLASEECESEHLDKAADALDRSQALIDDLLALAREGDQVGDLEAVPLADIVERCWGNVETGGATLVTATERTIRADPRRLQQLFENLIRNAIDHSSGDVTVTVGPLDGGFYVADDGPGIPEDERERVFEAGYSTADDGTGFGLNIVGEIVDAHGWKIAVTESEAGGARFEIAGVEFA